MSQQTLTHPSAIQTLNAALVVAFTRTAIAVLDHVVKGQAFRVVRDYKEVIISGRVFHLGSCQAEVVRLLKLL